MKINFTSGQNFQFPKTHKTFLRGKRVFSKTAIFQGGGAFFEEAYFPEPKILLFIGYNPFNRKQFSLSFNKKGKVRFLCSVSSKVFSP